MSAEITTRQIPPSRWKTYWCSAVNLTEDKTSRQFLICLIKWTSVFQSEFTSCTWSLSYVISIPYIQHSFCCSVLLEYSQPMFFQLKMTFDVQIIEYTTNLLLREWYLDRKFTWYAGIFTPSTSVKEFEKFLLTSVHYWTYTSYESADLTYKSIFSYNTF